MNFEEWQSLAPEAAAREVTRRAGTLLAPAQRRAVFAFLRNEAALEAAFRAAPRQAPLRGVPYLLKDLFDASGTPTFAGSTFLPEVRRAPDRDGQIVRDFAVSGAVLAGKTHLFEFACGLTGENAHYGDCEHPKLPGRTSGGSSSGSAAAVAAGVVPLATGTDTGGSVRVPAAFCGIYGYRGVPRDPRIVDAVPLAPGFDAPGWFTAEPGDMRATLDALVGLDGLERPPRGGYLEMPGMDPEVAAACRSAAEAFAPAVDRSTREELLDRFASAPEIYGVLTGVEAWRFHKAWVGRYRNRYGPLVLERLDRAKAVSRAQVAAVEPGWAALKLAWAHAFEAFDFLILPAVPFSAPAKADCTHANRLRILALTAPASLAGLPALAIPVPLGSGRTAGLQVVARHPKSPVFGWALDQVGAAQSSA